MLGGGYGELRTEPCIFLDRMYSARYAVISMSTINGEATVFCPSCGQKNQQEAKYCAHCGNQLPIVTSVVVSSKPVQSVVKQIPLYAGFWKRFAAMVIDLIVLTGPYIFISSIVESGLRADIIAILITWSYFAGLESSKWQATLGKLAIGIKVVDLQAQQISSARATGRYLAKILSGVLSIGYLMAAFTKRKQALHDIIAKCLVVNRNATPEQIQQETLSISTSTAAVVGFIVAGIVVSAFIIGVLAAIVIPAYQDYVIRSTLFEVVSIGDQTTRAVENYIYRNGKIPSRVEDVGISSAPNAKYVKSVTVNSQNGVVRVVTEVKPNINGSIIFDPSPDNNHGIIWRCSSIDIPPKYLPQQCR